MNLSLRSITLMLALGCLPLTAEEPNPLSIHREGAEKLAEEQDELSADVQQLVLEQTNGQVIQLLSQVEDIMDETTDRLADSDTGADTIAAQTEIIEKIAAAAQKKQEQSRHQASDAMLEMMKHMMNEGKKPGKPGKDGKDGKKPGQEPGKKPGQGQSGESNTLNAAINGDADGSQEIRRVPKSSGTTSNQIPEELRQAFDAYNRGAEPLIQSP